METDKSCFVWPAKARSCLSEDAAGINASIKLRITFMVRPSADTKDRLVDQIACIIAQN
jgi:hypothetical protein